MINLFDGASMTTVCCQSGHRAATVWAIVRQPFAASWAIVWQPFTASWAIVRQPFAASWAIVRQPFAAVRSSCECVPRTHRNDVASISSIGIFRNPAELSSLLPVDYLVPHRFDGRILLAVTFLPRSKHILPLAISVCHEKF